MPTIRAKVGVRKKYKEFKKSHKRASDVTFLMQDWDDAYNVGSMLRVADAVGCTKVYASGKTPIPPDPMIGVTSLGHHRRIEIVHAVRHDDAVAMAKADGYELIAVEIADDSVCYQEFEYPAKCCLVLGNEGAGVYGNVLRACTASVFIPQFGKGRSMNVHVAGAVVAFQAVMG